MARKRMIDPDFWNDEKLGAFRRDERLFFMGLISNADDEGRGRANSKLLKSTIFPYDEDLKSKDIEQMLINLSNKKIVFVYVLDGQEFYYLPNFSKHQVINKPQPSKIPEMPENEEEMLLPEYYGNTTVALPPNIREKKIKEKKRKEYNIEIPFSEIVDYLNQKTKSSFRPSSEKTKECISARWNDGFRLEDFKKVIDNKTTEWLNDTKMSQYLRPETLFGTKFEGYLNQKRGESSGQATNAGHTRGNQSQTGQNTKLSPFAVDPDTYKD